MASQSGIQKTISFNVEFMWWIVVAFLTTKLYFPTVLTQIIAVGVVGNVFVTIYSILSTIVAILLIPSIVVLYMYTYSEKFDSTKMNINLSNKTKLLSQIFSWCKSIFLIYISAQTGYTYLTVIASIMILGTVSIFVIRKDLMTKVTVMTLAKE